MKTALHPFTIRQLQYVVAVADALSFRRAAERCHVSQPSLSAQLAQLERALGVRLFERDRRRVIATAAGQDIVERARRLLVQADDLFEAGVRAGDPLAGTMRLGVIPTVSPYMLPAIAPILRERFPRLKIAWVEEKTESLLKKLAEGSLEGAILALEGLDAAAVELGVHVIATDPFVVASSREHALAKKKSAVSDAELAGEDLLLLDEGHCFRHQALRVCNAVNAREGEFRATSLSTLVQMVAGGAGITLLPFLAVEAEAKRAHLHVRPMADPQARRTLALVCRKNAAVEPALEAIAHALRRAFPQGAGPGYVAPTSTRAQRKRPANRKIRARG